MGWVRVVGGGVLGVAVGVDAWLATLRVGGTLLAPAGQFQERCHTDYWLG